MDKIPESVHRFFNGAVSGTVTAAWLQPFDVVRTTQQGLARDPTAVKMGPIAVARYLIAQEGTGALWKGLAPTITRVFFGAGIYFASIQALKQSFEGAGKGSATSSISSSGSNYQSFVIGATARSIAAAIMSPISVVKTRAEFGKKDLYGGTFKAVGQIARTEGIGALYAGLIPTIVRDAPFSGIYFMCYSRLSAWLDSGELSHIVTLPAARNFISGLLAGGIATLITQPADLIRTRLQLSTVNGGFLSSGTVILTNAREIINSSGFTGLFLGGTARVMKRALSTAITWTLFEEAMRRSVPSG